MSEREAHELGEDLVEAVEEELGRRFAAREAALKAAAKVAQAGTPPDRVLATAKMFERYLLGEED